MVLGILIRITGIIEKILKYTIILGIPSKILGFVVGIVEGFIITFLLLFFFRQPQFKLDIFEGSKLTSPILNSTPVLSQVAGSFVDTVNDLYDLGYDYYRKQLCREYHQFAQGFDRNYVKSYKNRGRTRKLFIKALEKKA